MSIRNKILFYFSVVSIMLVSAALFFIYTLFSEYREEEFQQRQKEKIETTLKFLTEIQGIDEDLIEAMDRITINDIYDEKLLIFDKQKNLVYASIDDTPISFSGRILNELSTENPWIEGKDGLYDVVGVYIEREDKAYFGISKAFDIAGYAKLNYLRYAIFFALVLVSLAIILIAYYLSKKITQSIFSVTRQIKDFHVDGKNRPIVVADTNDEIGLLVTRFNELMQRMNTSFSFQKHAVHHISHELKTPIAILVSDFEKIEKETNVLKIKELLKIQKENTKSLGEIINALLDIAKAESGNEPAKTDIRMDELIFDVASEIGHIHPDFKYSIEYEENNIHDSNLTIQASERLIRAAVSNLMMNCVQYSADGQARIKMGSTEEHLFVEFINRGTIISAEDQQYLFQHFFRGANSQGKRGFGLGLVFIDKILTMYGGKVAYRTGSSDTNIFSIVIPLRVNLSGLS